MRKKKILSAVISAAMAFGFMSYMPQTEVFEPMTAEAVSYSEALTYGDYLTYKKVDEDGDSIYDYVEISGCDTSATSVEIPSELENLAVTSIGDYAFNTCEALENIIIPESITSIGANVFTGTLWLEAKIKENPLVIVNNILIAGSSCSGDVVIPDGVTSIAGYAFSLAFNVTSITIPYGVTSIGDYAFYNCDKLESVTIPNSVTSIGKWAFYLCGYGLKSITLPESVSSIGDHAFYECNGLESITIENPDCEIFDSSYTITSKAAIYGYSNSTALTYAEDYNRNFYTLDADLFSYERIDEDGDKIYDSVMINGCNSSATDLVIPSEIGGLPVTSIEYKAFYTRSDITSVVFGDNVKKIGESAFTGCTNLKSVTLGKNVKYMGHFVFSGCTSLTDITIPESLTDIGYNVFRGTAWLEEKKAENPIVTVNNILIDGTACSGDVIIPDGVKYIAGSAFSGCEALTSIVLPDSITSIDYFAFYQCTALTDITIPDGVTAIGPSAFSDTAIKEIVIPESVAYIDNAAFYSDCLESITIKNPECTIYSHTTLVTISTNATIYGYENSTAHTFAEKYGNKFVSLGEAPVVTTTVVTTTTTTTSSTVSEITESSETETGSATKTDISEVTTTETSVSSATTTTITVTTTQQTTISGEIYNDLLVYKKVDTDNDKKYDYIEIIDCNPSAVSVEIPDKIDGLPVTSIGNDAFENCTSLESVTIPEGVTNIGNYAFQFCESLESITIPKNVTIIEDYAFSSCNSLTSITIPKNVESIATTAFWFCESITDFNVDKNNSFYTDIDGVMFNKEQTVLVAYPIGRKDKSYPIPDSVTRIENQAFSGSDALESITFHNNITEIGDYAFSNCRVLTNVIFSESVTTIGGHAFSHTPWLEAKRAENPLVIVNNILIDGETCSGDITIPAGVIVIGKQAFYSCETLTGITIGNDVASIEEFAFAHCDSLETVTISKNALSIAGWAFTDCKSLESVTIESPYCYIYDSSYTINNGYAENVGYYYDGIIYGYSDSTAQEYAEINGYKFESLGIAPVVKPSTSTECDANGDGETNIRDAAAIATALAKGQLDKLSLAADFNGDGKVNIRDAAALASALAKGEI